MSPSSVLPLTRATAFASFCRRVFTRLRREPAEEPTDYQSLQGAAGSLDAEYQKLVSYHLQRWGVPDTCVTVVVRQVGQDKRGREVFVAIVKLSRWERDVAVRLLLGLPLFEKKIRRVLQGSWVAEVSDFEGLWLHATDEMLEDTATSELRQLAVTLTGRRFAASTRGQAGK